jgi:aminoglycoside 3-N-acetyltransferase I
MREVFGLMKRISPSLSADLFAESLTELSKLSIMDFTIKRLDASEISLAKELFVWFQMDDGVDKPLVPSDHYLRTLLLKDDFYVIVATDNEKVIGGLTAFILPMYKEEISEIFLYEIGVNEAYRKKGVAKELIDFLKKIGVRRGIQEMYVGTEMHNIPAQKLYDRTGGKFETIAWYVYDLGK